MNLVNQIEYLKEFLQLDMFDGCSVPAGLDMDRVRGAIVMRCGLLTPLFSEPEVQRNATQQFFFENQWNFEHVIKIMNAEYSPIENVAEWRTETTSTTGKESTSVDRFSNEQHSGIDKREIAEDTTKGEQETGTTDTADTLDTTITESGNTTTQESGSTTTTREISAENATTYQADNKETVQHGRGEAVTHGKVVTTDQDGTSKVESSRETTGTEDKDTVDQFTHGHTIDKTGQDQEVTDRTGQTDYTVFRHGNVGVTTNQQMINEELDLLNRFNPYRFIADLYEKELILGIY